MKTAENGTHTDREEELRRIFEGIDDDVGALIRPTVGKVLYLEEKMSELETLPMIQVHPDDATRQRTTPAARLYKEFLQQHTNCIKLLASVLIKNAPEEVSPLRQWLDERNKQHGTG